MFDDDEAPPEGLPAWMATFSDMATLLLTFFVLMLSFANMDVKEFREALGSVREALGVKSQSSGEFMALSTSFLEWSDKQSYDQMSIFENENQSAAIVSKKGEDNSRLDAVAAALETYLESVGTSVDEAVTLAADAKKLLSGIADAAEGFQLLASFMEGHGFDPNAARGVLFVAEQLQRQMEADRQLVDGIREFLDSGGLGDSVDVQVTPRGVVVRLNATVLFESGRETLSPGAPPQLDVIADLARRFPHTMAIEGHTDDLPISTARFPSNWELSTARAVAVMRYLVHIGRVDEQRLKIAGYGEQRPLASNADPTGRARNRRVEFVFERRAGGKVGSPLSGAPPTPTEG